MMKKNLAILLIILGFQSAVTAQENNEIFTIYLVRHSEKDLTTNNHSDPPLTQCGKQRSQSLSIFLQEVKLDAVYSTNYTRTKKTATPTALSKGLKIQEYNSEELEEFSKLLLKNKQDVLVVGHSNTTGVLAGLLVGKEIGDFDLNIYNRIYQVVISNNNGRLHLLHTAFVCNE